MNHLKILGLAAVAATSLVACLGAGSASATVLCKNTVSSGCGANDYAAGTALSLSLKAGSTAKLEAGGITLYTCTGGTLSAITTNTGGASSTVTASATAGGVTWTGCTFGTDTVTGGELEFHNVAGTSNGTVTAKGFAFTLTHTQLGTCTYGFPASTDFGTHTHGTATTDAELVIKTTWAKITAHPNGAFCPATGVWSATYTVTSPTPLSVSTS
jgi:hypothetical protein